MGRPTQTDPQFKLRLTPELKAVVEKGARANNRSLNAEILARLEDSSEIEKRYIPIIQSLEGDIAALQEQRAILRNADTDKAVLAELIAMKDSEISFLRRQIERMDVLLDHSRKTIEAFGTLMAGAAAGDDAILKHAIGLYKKAYEEGTLDPLLQAHADRMSKKKPAS